jgi:DNA repair protein RadD
MLRDYQIDLCSRISDAHDAGLTNVLAVAPCGSGKTVMLRTFAENSHGMSVAIAHRQELIAQMSLTFARGGLSHRVIAPNDLIRSIIALHMEHIGSNFIRPESNTVIASVDTLIRREIDFSKVALWQCDETHHLQATCENFKGNKWGRAIVMLNAAGAQGIGWTATPSRTDRKSLKRGRGGVFDHMEVGPSARELIGLGHLADYRLYGLPQAMNMSHVGMRGGDFDARDLGREAKASAITGDIVRHYQRLASGLTGITFAVDVEMATEHAQAFRAAGVPAAVLHNKTLGDERRQVNRAIRNGELLQVVNVDILGEGADFPTVHCVSMARPTMSLGLFIQQAMRPMRPDGPEKKAVLLDHVGNVQRHGLPDAHREWTLDTPEKRGNVQVSVGLQICGNPECMLAYEGYEPTCPFCGWERPKGQSGGRERPEMLEGDLTLYTEEMLRELRGEVARIGGVPILPAGLDGVARRGAERKWQARAEALASLQVAIDQWGGYWVGQGDSVRAAYRRFYATFGCDTLTAQLGAAKELTVMREKVQEDILRCSVNMQQVNI